MRTVLQQRRSPWLFLILLCGLVWSMTLVKQLPAGHDISWLWHNLLNRPSNDIDAVLLHDSSLPRFFMALMVGAALGLSGCLMQQLSRNVLVSPMTLGSASGAWLAIVCAAAWWPALIVQHIDWFAMGGAIAATGLLLLLTGIRRLGSLHLVLAGMALNVFLGALATAIALSHDRYLHGLFVWGAGDLSQYDWHWLPWLAIRLFLPLLLLPLLARPLTLLRVGEDAAAGLGLALWPALLTVLLVSLWLSAVAVAAAGLIGFISVLIPAMARRLGIRGIKAQWLASAGLGALLLLLTDSLAQLATQWLNHRVSSGVAAAMIGAPALIWLLREVRNPPQGLADLTETQRAMAPVTIPAYIGWGAGLLLIGLSCLLTRNQIGWQLAWPDALIWSLRWPRLLAAAGSGIGLAVSGTILQRLLRNPLASPDLLGISAGATLAVMLYTSLLGIGLQQGGWLPALCGSLLTLAFVLWIGRRFAWAPSALVLAGLALSALLDGMVNFMLTGGKLDNMANMAALSWLAGSTYRVHASTALLLIVAVSLCLLLAWLSRRSLTLLTLADEVAAGCGLNVKCARTAWLLLAALLCALVTSFVGPIGFIGMLTPHLAQRLGARSMGAQLLAAAFSGSVLMLIADAFSRTLFFPMQFPVGLCASLLCGFLLILALVYRGIQR